MSIWVSADLHIGHKGIIALCKRPFATVEEMNEALVTRWNEKISVDAEVWFLGDFCWRGYEHFFHRLNGTKHLIIGNHDHRNVLSLPWASQPKDRHELKLSDTQGKIYDVVLDHYPLEEWNGFYRGSVHLHGHVHARKLNDIPNRFDVGVDNTNFMPVTIDDILIRVPHTSPGR